MARDLNIGSTKTLISVQGDKISVDYVIDDGKSVIAEVSFYNNSFAPKRLVLWEGEAYNEIGQWTDADVDKEIKKLLSL